MVFQLQPGEIFPEDTMNHEYRLTFIICRFLL